MENKNKTFVDDIERTLYDIRNEDHSAYKSQKGLTEDVVRDISARKHDPQWMLERRLQALEYITTWDCLPGGRICLS